MARSWSSPGALAWRGGLVSLTALAACSAPTVSAIMGPTTARPAPLEPLSVPVPDTKAIQAPLGYRCEAVVTGLTYPTSLEVDPQGNLYIAEAGFVWGDPWGQP